MKKDVLGISLGILVSVWSSRSYAATDRYVAHAGQTPDNPSKYTSWGGAASNIQDAVGVANAGDTVWVSNGTYVLSAPITIGDLSLRSWPDGLSNRDTTIVDGNYPNTTNRCFVLNNAGALVEGFTITNGTYARAAPDTWDLGGGGVYMTAGTLRNCRIAGNRTINGNGAGVCARYADTVIDRCELIGNMNLGRLFGGGAHLRGYAQIWNSTIQHNTSSTTDQYGGGGGVSSVRDEGRVYNSIIVSNTVNAGGGGVLNLGLLRSSLVAGNTAFWIDGSSQDLGGGGVYVHDAAATRIFSIESSTIVGNSGRHSGGIWFLRNGRLYVTNTIAYNNVTHTGASNNIARHGAYDNAIYCDRVCTTNTTLVTFVGDGNITNKPPAFANYAAGDYRLMTTSPCVDAGANQAWMAAEVDLDGKPRKMGDAVDIGCYELTPPPQGSVISIR